MQKTLYSVVLANGQIHLAEAYTKERAARFFETATKEKVLNTSEFTKEPPPGSTIWDVEGST